MSDFQLETSGYVQCPAPDQRPNETTGCWFWSNLDAFTQAYEGAARQELAERLMREGMSAEQAKEATAFHRWAPETLETIIRDCGHAKGAGGMGYGVSADYGRQFWASRQNEIWAYYRPVTPTLGDDGKMRFQ